VTSYTGGTKEGLLVAWVGTFKIGFTKKLQTTTSEKCTKVSSLRLNQWNHWLKRNQNMWNSDDIQDSDPDYDNNNNEWNDSNGISSVPNKKRTFSSPRSVVVVDDDDDNNDGDDDNDHEDDGVYDGDENISNKEDDNEDWN
jgi:hypothetical protein